MAKFINKNECSKKNSIQMHRSDVSTLHKQKKMLDKIVIFLENVKSESDFTYTKKYE